MRAPGTRLPRPRAAAIAIVVVLSVAVPAACSSGGNEPRADRRRPSPSSTTTTTTAPLGQGEPAAPPPLDWQSCRGGECARLTVPLDDAAALNGTASPNAPTIELAMFRRPAGDPARRVGSLLLNPGGPGASGTDLARAASSFLPDSVLDRFDVVGWDPRGVGASSPARCGDHLDYLFSGDPSPDDPAEWDALDDVSRRFAGACATDSGPALLSHVSTLETVHDMERIRLALGDAALTYAGFSYGTALGGVYATLYPDRVRAMVLDGAVDMSLSLAESTIEQAEGLEHGFDAFLADCRGDRSCPIQDDPARVYERVASAIEAEPLPGRLDGEERRVTPAMLDLAVSSALYDQGTWPDLQRALAEADGGDGRGLLRLFDAYVGRDSEGRYSDEWASFLAISCLDGPSLGGPDVYRAVEAAAAVRAPRFGAANVGLGLPCAFWTVPPAAPLPSISAPAAAPVVVIGTQNDPITPVRWAEALTRQLGGAAQLVVYNGQGHTSFGSGDDCLDERIAAYLVDLTLPPVGLVCGSG